MAMLLLTGSRMDQPDLTGLGMESPERLISIYFNARGRYWYFSYEIDSLPLVCCWQDVLTFQCAGVMQQLRSYLISNYNSYYFALVLQIKNAAQCCVETAVNQCGII